MPGAVGRNYSFNSGEESMATVLERMRSQR